MSLPDVEHMNPLSLEIATTVHMVWTSRPSDPVNGERVGVSRRCRLPPSQVRRCNLNHAASEILSTGREMDPISLSW